MITGEHIAIRMSDPDDADALYTLYTARQPRAALLDKRREPLMPARDELRETLARRENTRGLFYTLEDCEGRIRGFASLGGMLQETGTGELRLLLHETADHAAPLADEAVGLLLRRAFVRMRLSRLTAHCLEGEHALAGLLRRHGFLSEGVQRDVLYAGGRWHNMESLARLAPRSGAPADAEG
jgi:RimJ/RimL family protein N-acetyltransferase